MNAARSTAGPAWSAPATRRGVSSASSSPSTSALMHTTLLCAAVSAVAREWMGAVKAPSWSSEPPSTSSSVPASLVSRDSYGVREQKGGLRVRGGGE
jgi:hypothetical protein